MRRAMRSVMRAGVGLDGDALELQRDGVAVDEREHPQRRGGVARGRRGERAAR